MFTEVEFEWKVIVEPCAMKSGAHIQKALILRLLKDFNNVKCTSQHGYHVTLTTLEQIGEGIIWERRGCAAFPVRFRCVLFNVFKNEHVLAVVTQALSTGLMCECGPIDNLFVAKKFMEDYELMSGGAEDITVTQWVKKRNGAVIMKGNVVRVKILGTKWDPTQRTMTAVGCLDGDYAGVDDRWPDPQKAQNSVFGGGNLAGDEAGPSGWGEPSKSGDDGGASGWGEPAKKGDEGGGWGSPVNKGDDGGASGWGEPVNNGDDDGASGWD